MRYPASEKLEIARALSRQANCSVRPRHNNTEVLGPKNALFCRRLAEKSLIYDGFPAPMALLLRPQWRYARLIYPAHSRQQDARAP
jgi:hypothetical protein